MQNFGGQTKSIMVFSEVAYCERFCATGSPLGRIVYKFTRAGCNASYIGETTHHISTRVREHLVSDKASHVLKHLASSKACRDSCSTECFTLLDSANSRFKIKIKEALHIKCNKPTLNQQLQHFGISLSV